MWQYFPNCPPIFGTVRSHFDPIGLIPCSVVSVLVGSEKVGVHETFSFVVVTVSDTVDVSIHVPVSDEVVVAEGSVAVPVLGGRVTIPDCVAASVTESDTLALAVLLRVGKVIVSETSASGRD